MTIVIPTFNRCRYVQTAVESVLNQTFTDYEIIVVDDGSTDGTSRALEPYGIRYIYQENAGESRARNHGIKLSSGEYIALLDSDDLWMPHKLQRQLDSLSALPECGLVFAEASLINTQGASLPILPLGHGMRQDELTVGRLLVSNFVAGSASNVLLRKSALEKTALFDETIRFGEDWDLWIQLALTGCKFHFIPEPLVMIRLYPRGWLPNSEDVDQMLADHLRIVDKSFRSLPASMDNLRGLKGQALARCYGRAAFADYYFGRTAEAMEKLGRAATFDRETWTVPIAFRNAAVEYAIGLSNTRSVEAAQDFLSGVYDHLPPGLIDLREDKKQARAHLYIGEGFRSYFFGDLKAARQLMGHGVAMAPQWLANRGVLSVLARTIKAGP